MLASDSLGVFHSSESIVIYGTKLWRGCKKTLNLLSGGLTHALEKSGSGVASSPSSERHKRWLCCDSIFWVRYDTWSNVRAPRLHDDCSEWRVLRAVG